MVFMENGRCRVWWGVGMFLRHELVCQDFLVFLGLVVGRHF